jgi:hypothetical protein
MGVHIRLVISIGCFMSYGSAIKGPTQQPLCNPLGLVFYALHRRLVAKGFNPPGVGL